VRKLPDNEYIRNLAEYIGRYDSDAVQQLVPEQVRVRPEPTALRKCLGYLLNFVYTRIATKRRQAIDNMELAAVEGKRDPARFRESVHTYFDSKYYPELFALRRELNVAHVWEYIDKVRGILRFLFRYRGNAGKVEA